MLIVSEKSTLSLEEIPKRYKETFNDLMITAQYSLQEEIVRTAKKIEKSGNLSYKLIRKIPG